jgi:WD40 repeat protein
MALDIRQLFKDEVKRRVVKDNTLRLWDVETRKQLHTFNDYSERVSSPLIEPSGKRVLVGTKDGAVWFDVATGNEVGRLTSKPVSAAYVALSSDGKHAVVTGQGAQLVDVATGNVLHTFSAGSDENAFGPKFNRKVSCVKYLPDSHEFVFGTMYCIQTALFHCRGDTRAVVQKLKTPEMSGFNPHTEDSWVSDISVFPDGRRILVSTFYENKSAGALLGNIVAASEGRRMEQDKSALRIWDLDEGKVTHKFTTQNGWCTASALSPDGWLAATGHTDGSIFLWGLPGDPARP